jgi:hypothetical protein
VRYGRPCLARCACCLGREEPICQIDWSGQQAYVRCGSGHGRCAFGAPRPPSVRSAMRRDCLSVEHYMQGAGVITRAGLGLTVENEDCLS